jgi:hypothetical protein
VTTAGASEEGNAGSLLGVGVVGQLGGSVHVGGGARAVTLDYNLAGGGSLSLINPSSVGGTATLTATQTVGGFALDIAGSTFSLSAGANALLVGNFRNQSATSAQGGSSILTRTVTNAGSISLQTGSMLNTNQNAVFNPFNNTGTFTLASGSSATTGAFANNFVPGVSNGDVVLEGGSTLTATTTFTNSGGVIVFSGSTLGTGAFTNTGGTVDVSDPGSRWLILGPVVQTNGSVRIQNGARGVTTTYGLTTGSLSLSQPSSVAGTSTLDVTGNFTNTGGAVNEVNGATFLVRGNVINSGSISLQGASTVVALDAANAFTGSIDLTGGSTATLDDLDNRGLVRVFGMGSILSTLATDGDTANGGQIVVDASARWINGDFGARLAGGGIDDITNANGGFGGQVIVQAGGNLDAGRFINPQHDSLLHVSGLGSSAALLSIPNNSGSIRVDAGATIAATGTVNMTTGTIDVQSTAADAAPTVFTIGGPTGGLSNSGLVNVNGPMSRIAIAAGVPATTNILGEIVLNNGAILDSGPAGARVGMINGVGILPPVVPALPAQLLVSGGSKFNSGAFINNPGSLVKVSGAGSAVTIFGMGAAPRGPATNFGIWITDPGGVTNSGAVSNGGGSISVDGAGSKWNTGGDNFGTTNGQVSAVNGGVLDLRGAGGVRGTFTATGGDNILIDGAGSAFHVDTTSITGGTFTISQGGVLATAAGGSDISVLAASNFTITDPGSSTVASSFLNSGGSDSIVANGAALTINMLMQNLGGSTFELHGAASTLTSIFGGLTNDGSSLFAASGGTATFTGPFSGFTSKAGSTMVVRNGANVRFASSSSNGALPMPDAPDRADIDINSTGVLRIGGAGGSGGFLASLINVGSINVTTKGRLLVDGDVDMKRGATQYLDGEIGGGVPNVDIGGNLLMNGIVGDRAVVKISNGAILRVMGNVNMAPPGVPNGGNAYDIDPATMIVGGDFNLYTKDILRVDGGSDLFVGDDVANSMDVPANWDVTGRVTLNGGGVDVQTFEVSGRDFGNTTSAMFPTLIDLFDSAYVQNYNIGDRALQGLGTLRVTPQSVVNFINSFDNSLPSLVGTDDFATQPLGAVITSTGALAPAADGEALYVNRLVLDPASILDLGLLHVYYREVSFDGGLTFQPGDFADVLTWLGNGITFVPAMDGTTRYPIPFTGVIPEPSGLLLIVVCGVCLASLRRSGGRGDAFCAALTRGA